MTSLSTYAIFGGYFLLGGDMPAIGVWQIQRKMRTP